MIRAGSGEELAQLHDAIVRCEKCHLAKTRTNAVPGEGSAKAGIIFVGEAPGKQEDLQGRPFVGRAGKFLNELLANIGVRRGEVFIGNVLKCRPISQSGSDRKPNEEEVSACAPYLDRQIDIIKPRIICPLGDTATSYILRKYGLKVGKISKIHGKALKTDSLRIFPLFHPAAALYTYQLGDVMRRDFKKLGNLLKQSTLESF